ncbi:MAG TPA: nucleotidyltransferase family protein [Thermoanaerobaculia bacterium]
MIAGARFLPTRDEHELLRAALLENREEAIASFYRWKQAVDFENIEIGSLRLMPLLHRSLRRYGVDDELMPRLRGIYRQVWFRNHLILKAGLQAVEALREQQISSLLIKGAALVATVYDDVALRPMDDFDLVVHRADFRRALAVITGIGWQLDPSLPDPESHLEFEHAIGLRREGSGDLDLHWASTWGAFDTRGEEEFWSSSVEATVAGTSVRVLAPPDQLLQLCTHATQLNAMAPIRWVADSLFILQKAGATFDWQRLAHLARIRSLSLTQLQCLEYLRNGLGVRIPDEAMASLRRNGTLPERIVLQLKVSTRAKRRWYAALMWRRLIFLDGLPAVPRRFRLFRRYLRSVFRVSAGGSLPRVLLGRLTRPAAAVTAQSGTKQS